MFFLIVIVFLLSDHYSTVTANACNDKCLSKTYCISKDGTSEKNNVCSKDNFISVVFTMDQVDNELYFSLTLTEYQIATNKTSHAFELILSSGSSKVTYYCRLNSYKALSYVFQNNYQLAEGSSQYTNNNLQCNWNVTKASKAWPFYIYGDYNRLVLSKDVSLTLKYDIVLNRSRSIILANDSSELPFYRLQSLKCCNKVYGSDQFSFIFHQDDDHINYYLQFFDSSSSDVLISFTNLKGVKLVFTCNRKKSSLTGLIQDGTFVSSLNRELFNARVEDSSCSWITPLSLSYGKNQLNLLADNFDLKLISDNVILYGERNVQFEKTREMPTSSGQSSLTPLAFITLISTYYLQLILS